MTLANILSFSRIVLILPIIFFCFNESFSFNIFGIIVYIFAALTDYFDDEAITIIDVAAWDEFQDEL